MANTITEATNKINTEIRNKVSNKSVTRANVSDNLQLLVNNMQPDMTETDPNALTYVQNKSTVQGLGLIATVTYTTWNQNSVFTYNAPVGTTPLKCVPHAIPKTNITIDGITYTPNSRVQQTNTGNLVATDASGCSTDINGNTIRVLPKTASLYEDSGSGGNEYTESSSIIYEIDIYGI